MQLYLEVIVPADGTRAATVRNGDFGTSPVFGQLSDKPLLAYLSYVVCDAQRTRRGKKLGAGPNGRPRNPVVRQFNVFQKLTKEFSFNLITIRLFVSICTWLVELLGHWR
jgi:hypothetical protein